jgi:hypothetical protein
MVNYIFLRRREGILAGQTLLHALLDHRAIFTAASQTIGSVAQINPLDSISNDSGGFVHTPDAIHRERSQLLSIVQNAPSFLVSHPSPPASDLRN